MKAKLIHNNETFTLVGYQGELWMVGLAAAVAKTLSQADTSADVYAETDSETSESYYVLDLEVGNENEVFVSCTSTIRFTGGSNAITENYSSWEPNYYSTLTYSTQASDEYDGTCGETFDSYKIVFSATGYTSSTKTGQL